MQINSKITMDGVEYDVEYCLSGLDANLKGQFIQRIYNKYKTIRQIMGGRKCQQPYLAKVKQWLSEPENMEKVTKTIPYSEDDIAVILYVAEYHIKMIK